MECLNCPNRRHKKPKRVPTAEYLAIVTEDMLRCARLLQAIFHPEVYYHHHDTRKNIELPPIDVAEVQ